MKYNDPLGLNALIPPIGVKGNTGLQPVGGGMLTTPAIGEGPKHDVTPEPTEKPSTTLTNPISDIGKTRALIHTIPEIIESLKHVTPIAGEMFQQLFVTRGGDDITVRHYTNDEGRNGISESGFLDENTYVTLPNEMPSNAGHTQIEKMLKIKKGRGSNYIDVNTAKGNLVIPENGSKTGGKKWQRQLVKPVSIKSSSFKRPPGRPKK